MNPFTTLSKFFLVLLFLLVGTIYASLSIDDEKKHHVSSSSRSWDALECFLFFNQRSSNKFLAISQQDTIARDGMDQQFDAKTENNSNHDVSYLRS